MPQAKAQPRNRKRQASPGRKTPPADLAELARIGALFVDGDALDDIFASGRDWTSADDINFRHGPFIEIKRTVLKIERLADGRCGVLVAIIRQDDPSKVEAVVCATRNDLGRAPVPMTAAMRRCVKRGEVTTERGAKTGDLRAYAPIKTSEGDAVGLLMVSG